MRRLALTSALGLALTAAPCVSRAVEPLSFFVAASLTDAAEAAGENYRKETGRPVSVHSASSALLVSQLLRGAEADVVITASEESMRPLADQGRLAPGYPRPLLTNRLVAVVKKGAGRGPAGLDILVSDRVESVAIGDPEIVPAGRYARSALVKAGIWEEIQPKMVPAMDVRAALALVAGGDVELGIVYLTDARLEDRVEILFELTQEETRPIRYPIAVLRSAADPEGAARLAEYLLGDDGERLFQNYGFEVIR